MRIVILYQIILEAFIADIGVKDDSSITRSDMSSIITFSSSTKCIQHHLAYSAQYWAMLQWDGYLWLT